MKKLTIPKSIVSSKCLYLTNISSNITLNYNNGLYTVSNEEEITIVITPLISCTINIAKYNLLEAIAYQIDAIELTKGVPYNYTTTISNDTYIYIEDD